MLWFFLGILLLITAAPFLLPLKPIHTVEAGALADEQSRFVTANGWRIHYKETGQGEPALVLLHGFGASLFSWREVLARPEGLGRIYAFDRPAFGLTERKLPADYSPEAQVDLLVSLLDRWGIKRAVLVGNSAGGTVALHTALRHPDRVAGLVLVDAAVYRGGGAPPFIKPLLATRWGERVGLHLLRRFGDRFVQGILSSYHDPAKVTDAVKMGYLKSLRVHNWDRALWAFTLASRQSNLANRLPAIKQPCLVVTGENDRIVPAAESERLARELPGAQLVTIPQCGHLPQEECPEAFLGALRRFVASLSTQPTA